MSSLSVSSLFRGRLARKPYWIAIGVLVGVRLLAGLAAYEYPDWAGLLETSDVVVFLIPGLIGRRMRDFGRSAIWGWFGMALVEIAGIVFTIQSGGLSAAEGSLGRISPAVEFRGSLLLLALIAFVGFIRGDSGANRYGPAPGGAPGRQVKIEEDDDGAGADALIARALADRSGAPIARDASPLAANRPTPPTVAAGARVFGKRR